VDFSNTKIFVKEVFSSFALLRGERIEFSNFGDNGVGKVDFMIVSSRRENMVGGFLGEDKGELKVFRERVIFGLTALAATASLVAVVRWAMMGEPIEMN